MESEQLKAIAKLAKLQIAEENIDEVATSITNVLALVDQLSAADLDNVEPMAHPLDAVQRLRVDKVTEENVREQFQAIAPATENGLFLVPKVIDS